MAINFSQVKSLTISEGDVKSISVGGVTVWQKPVQNVTITYRKCIYQSSAPASKTVPAGYVLTSADIPTSSSGDWAVTGWTLDGTNTVSAGYVVNSNIELCGIMKYKHTSGSLFKSAKNYAYEGSVTLSVNNGAVGNSSSGTTMTYTNSKSYTASTPGYDYYRLAQLGSWGGLIGTIDLEHAARIEWTPSRNTVTFSSSMSGGTNAYNYTATYPTLVLRHVGTKALIYSKTQNSTSKITYNAPEPNSGSKVRVYIQHGGNDGGQKLASRADYKQQYDTPSSTNYGITCNASTATETVYFYTKHTNS